MVTGECVDDWSMLRLKPPKMKREIEVVVKIVKSKNLFII